MKSQYDQELIAGIQKAIDELDHFEWSDIMLDDNLNIIFTPAVSKIFEDLEWILTNLDHVEYGPARYWYFDTFEDNNQALASWLSEHFDDNWAKVAEYVEW